MTSTGCTGVVGVIKDKTDSTGKVIGLRADMDALPIAETTVLDYASQTVGVMHACGLDGHSSMLLGPAKYLAATRQFNGLAVVIFQPAEEGCGGGREMCNDSMAARWNIQEVYGMHNWPGVPAGHFLIRSGPFLSATDQFDITVIGHGGHAEKSEETVISIMSFETSSKAYNVIPSSVHLRGTIRALTTDMRALAKRRLVVVAESTVALVARAISGQCDEVPQVMGERILPISWKSDWGPIFSWAMVTA